MFSASSWPWFLWQPLLHCGLSLSQEGKEVTSQLLGTGTISTTLWHNRMFGRKTQRCWISRVTSQSNMRISLLSRKRYLGINKTCQLTRIWFCADSEKCIWITIIKRRMLPFCTNHNSNTSRKQSWRSESGNKHFKEIHSKSGEVLPTKTKWKL